MSVDYDHLREWLDTVDQANHQAGDTIEFTHPGSTVEIVRELLRLRDGIEVVRDRCSTLAESAQEAGMPALAHEMGVNAQALTGLLKGDTE